MARRFLRKRSLDRRLVEPQHFPFTEEPSASADSTFAGTQYVTVRVPSRRLVRPADLSFEGLSSEPPVAAWITPARAIRRKATVRTNLTVLDAPVKEAAVVQEPLTALIKPKVIRVDFRRRLKQSAEIPWAQAPPASSESYPAFLAPPFLRRRETRRELPERVKHLPSYPQQGVVGDAQELPAWIPPKVHRTRVEKTLLKPRVPPVWPIGAQGYPAWGPDSANRRTGYRRLLRVVHLPSYPQAEVVGDAQELPAWLPPKQHRVSRKRTLLTAPYPPEFTQASVSQDTTWGSAPFRTVTHRSRRLVRVPAPEYTQPTPADSQEYPSWIPPKQFRVKTERRLLAALFTPVYPQAEVVGDAQELPAWLPPKQFRVERNRRHLTAPYPPEFTQAQPTPATLPSLDKKRAFLRRGRTRGDQITVVVTSVVIAQPIAKYPSWVPPPTLRRRETRHRLQRVIHLPAYPQAPIGSQSLPSWIPPKANKRAGWRRLLSVTHLPSYPEPSIGAQSLPAWIPPPVFRHSQERRLLVPLDAPVKNRRPEPPYPSWVPPRAFRWGQTRRLQSLLLIERPVGLPVVQTIEFDGVFADEAFDGVFADLDFDGVFSDIDFDGVI